MENNLCWKCFPKIIKVAIARCLIANVAGNCTIESLCLLKKPMLKRSKTTITKSIKVFFFLQEDSQDINDINGEKQIPVLDSNR